MKRPTIFTLGIIAAVLTTVVGADLALARGGGGHGAGPRMSQADSASQHQYQQQKRFQYRLNGRSEQAPIENRTMRSDRYQKGDRVQLRDPATHNRSAFVPKGTP